MIIKERKEICRINRNWVGDEVIDDLGGEKHVLGVQTGRSQG